MKTQIKSSILAVLFGIASTAGLHAQGTAFSYSGRLNDTNGPANGVYDLEFRVFDMLSGGSQQGSTTNVNDLSISNGLLTVTLDPGANVFTGPARWLNIAVRPGASAGAYTNLVPRQAITAAPYAIYAGKAMMLDGTLPSSQLSGTYSSAVTLNNGANSFTGNGAGLSNLNADLLDGLDATAFWKLGGNGGTMPGTHFLGTTDGQALEFKVNNQRALRLEPNVSGPNVILGHSDNVVSGVGVYAATIAGGSGNRATMTNSTIGGGLANRADGFASTVPGGRNNRATNNYSTVGGGQANLAGGEGSAVAGGAGNGATLNYSTVGGGIANLANNTYSTIAGGDHNTASGVGCAVGGGSGNRATDSYSTVSGGGDNIASHTNSTIGGGRINEATGLSGTVGGGVYNRARGDSSTIGGGFDNETGGLSDPEYSAGGATIGGGTHNSALAVVSTIGGGNQNTIYDTSVGATIGGGQLNYAIGKASTVPGGCDNRAAGDYSFAAGLYARALHAGTFVWADTTPNTDTNFVSLFESTGSNQFLIRASGGVGIGTTTPTHSLTISNSTDDVLRLIGPDSGFGFGAKLNFGDGDFVYLDEYADDRLRIQANRVGVGRDAAANRLEVEGEASKSTAGGWLANSDRRIKRDIQPVGHALETLDKVRPVSFRYTDDYRAEHASVENRRYLNVVAQEFREVFPEHVKSSGEKLPNGEDILQVDTYPLTIYSVAAIQELNRKVEQKETEITELKQKMDELKALVEAMNHKLNGAAR